MQVRAGVAPAIAWMIYPAAIHLWHVTAASELERREHVEKSPGETAPTTRFTGVFQIINFRRLSAPVCAFQLHTNAAALSEDGLTAEATSHPHPLPGGALFRVNVQVEETASSV